MTDLSNIQPYSGWRNSGTQGEQEALDYVEKRLGEFKYLRELGLKAERQAFRVFMATELWETRLALKLNGQQVEVPANGLRGDRDDIAQALRFDSDGKLNDTERNPVVVEGPVRLVRSASEIDALSQSELRGKIVCLDYAVIDRSIMDMPKAVETASKLVAKAPAGLVLVTRFSNKLDASHGAFVGDVNALNLAKVEPKPPTLYVRLEDLASAGIQNWNDLARIESARLTWDADVFSPAQSGNLVIRIPGSDPSRAVILGAHIDSPNSPGAMDDGSGSAILLEVARVLDAARVQPSTDLYLVWFGSEELGVYGSARLAATHSELLDRTLAMLQIDMLSRPLDGIQADLNLETWSYGRLGNSTLPWPDYLTRAAARRNIKTVPMDRYELASDNTIFSGFDVPNANLIYLNGPAMEATGSVHYAAHIHDPYDTVELAKEMGDAFEQMARVALIAALDAAKAPNLRVTPKPDRRALFVASHTEPVHMAPATFTDLGMALSMEGFDVDMIPYGQPVTAADLKDTRLVFALPVVDYTSTSDNQSLYDEAWSQDEVAALDQYVAEGGLLVLTNSAHRLKYGDRLLDINEDWSDMNRLAERFGVTYQAGTLSAKLAQAEGKHPLMERVSSLVVIAGNGVPFELAQGQVLARANGKPAVALVDYSKGQVLALADVGILNAGWGDPTSLRFWHNLTRYARAR